MKSRKGLSGEMAGVEGRSSMADNYAELIADLIECLRNPQTEEDAWHSFEHLEFLDVEGLPILQQFAVSERDEEIRATLVEIIWQRRKPESVPFLGQMLTDPGKKVWKAAIDGLVTLGTEDALVALKTTRAKVSSNEIEYIDEAIDQIEHPEAWLGMKRECSGADEESEPRGRTLIEANVTFLSAGEGGRDHPAKNSSEYRAHLVVDDPYKRLAIKADDERTLTENYLAVSFSGKGGPLLPNQSYDVRLLLIFYPHPAYNALVSGATFTIREGPKIVGYGRVTKGVDVAID